MTTRWDLITASELTEFRSNGYLVVPYVLSQKQLATLEQAADELFRLQQEIHAIQSVDRCLMSDVVGCSKSFLDLVDHPKILPRVVNVLGWNIQIYHSHLCFAPPIGTDGAATYWHLLHVHNPELASKLKIENAAQFWKWHRDSGQINFDLGNSGPHPMMSVKVAYFLTDVSEANRGNMYLIPGSQNDSHDICKIPEREHLNRHSECIKVPAGSAVIFDRRILHTSSPNFSDIPRKVLFLGYSFRWIRPRDNMTFDRSVVHTPIRQQLLGYARSGYGYSSPSESEVPLKKLFSDWYGSLAKQ